MELTKLIEQYERETAKKAKVELNEFEVWDISFVLWLASRPTCGQEQREFLSEVESKGKIDSEGYLVFPSYEPYYDSPGTQLDQSDFKSDLSKVIKGE
jgi:hypothetical protein